MYRLSLADFVLIAVFLIACFGAGMIMKTCREVEEMTKDDHLIRAQSLLEDKDIFIGGPAP